MKALAATARWLRGAAMIALLVMMAVTIVDVGMRATLNTLVLGSVEVVQLALVAVVFLALPETFLRGEHITVDALDQVASARLVRIARAAGLLATLLVVAVMAWRMLPLALDTLTIGDRTSDLGLSFVWYWLPLLVGSFVAALVVLARLLRRDVES